jgi:hypothetical protein
MLLKKALKNMIGIFRLKIAEYFDSLVNYIDIKAEESLVQECNNFNKDLINKNRNILIENIKKIESTNLAHLESANINYLESLSEDEEKLKAAIFKKFCFKLKRNTHSATFPFKFTLIITDQYLSKYQIDSFVRFLKNCEHINNRFDCDFIICQSNLNLADRFFLMKYQVSIHF